MKCTNCGEPIETGAAYCGNCGQAVVATTALPQPGASAAQPASPIAQVLANQPVDQPLAAVPNVAAMAGASPSLPAYAVPVPAVQSGHVKASMSLVFGILGIVGALFLPLAGLLLGVIGIVLATMSRRAVKHGISTVGIIMSVIAIIAALGTWAYAVDHDAQLKQQRTKAISKTNSAPAQASASLATPCYTINFASKLNVENVSGSCDMNAFDGATIDNSNDAYKIYATSSSVSDASFGGLAKQAIEKDVKQSLPSFTITKEVAGNFAGSPAYFVTTTNYQGVSLIEAAVLHQTANGTNFFVFVHASGDKTADLNSLQSGWQWQ